MSSRARKSQDSNTRKRKRGRALQDVKSLLSPFDFSLIRLSAKVFDLSAFDTVFQVLKRRCSEDDTAERFVSSLVSCGSLLDVLYQTE